MTRARELANLGNNTTDLGAINAVYDAGGLTGRNLIINGAMTVAQRGTSGTMTGDNQYISLDRWGSRTYGGTGRFSVAQNTTVPSGQTFTNSLKATVTTTATSGTYGYAIKQFLEGYTVNQLRTGTSDALKSTLSFWARSSVAGTYCCSVRGTAGAASYVFEYTLAADTWTKIEHTIAEPTTTTPSWDRTNAADYLLEWSLGGQTSKQTATTESWHDGNYTSTLNQTDWIATSGATFYLTGVQLEVGSIATPFEHKPYVQDVTECLRYFNRYRKTNSYGEFVTIRTYSATQGTGIHQFPTPMRAAPSLSIDKTVNTTYFAYNLNAISITGTDGNNTSCGFHATSASNAFVTGGGAVIQSNGVQDISFNLDAEL